jgi:hypothetical protein
MFAKPMALLVLIALLIMPACGKWPPFLKTKSDIQRLPASEQSIRARGLLRKSEEIGNI